MTCLIAATNTNLILMNQLINMRILPSLLLGLSRRVTNPICPTQLIRTALPALPHQLRLQSMKRRQRLLLQLLLRQLKRAPAIGLNHRFKAVKSTATFQHGGIKPVSAICVIRPALVLRQDLSALE